MLDLPSSILDHPAAPSPSGALLCGSSSGADPGPDDYQQSPVEVIRSTRQLVHLLHQGASAKQPVRLSSPHLGIGGATRLQAVDPDRHEVYVRPLTDADAHARLLKDSRCNLLLRQGESTILFSMTLLGMSLRNGQPCYLARLPEWAITSQLRRWRRTHLLPCSEVTLEHRFPDDDCIEARVTDIGEGGIGIALPHLRMRGFRSGERWKPGSLSVRNREIGRFALEVRYLRSEVDKLRIGLAIRDATETQMQKLCRFLLRLKSPAH